MVLVRDVLCDVCGHCAVSHASTQRWYWCGHATRVQSTDPSDDALLVDERGYIERTHRADAVVGIKIRDLTKVLPSYVSLFVPN